MPSRRILCNSVKKPEKKTVSFLLFSKISAAFEILTTETATAAPNNSNTIDTVVEVGNPKVLNKSSKISIV